VRQTYFQDYRCSLFRNRGSFFKTKSVDHHDFSARLFHRRSSPPHPPSEVVHFRPALWVSICGRGSGGTCSAIRCYKNTEFVVDLDVRGLIGDEFSFVEVSLALGFGK
jgi:hypothetical protein